MFLSDDLGCFLVVWPLVMLLWKMSAQAGKWQLDSSWSGCSDDHWSQVLRQTIGKGQQKCLVFSTLWVGGSLIKELSIFSCHAPWGVCMYGQCQDSWWYSSWAEDQWQGVGQDCGVIANKKAMSCPTRTGNLCHGFLRGFFLSFF